jgi:hypothetical protein
MNGSFGSQRLRLGLTALAAITLGGGAVAASMPAIAATTTVHSGYAQTHGWEMNLGGNYQYNGSQSVFTTVHCWSYSTDKVTWCGATPANTIGVNFISYGFGSTSHYLRISVGPNGQVSSWGG